MRVRLWPLAGTTVSLDYGVVLMRRQRLVRPRPVMAMAVSKWTVCMV